MGVDWNFPHVFFFKGDSLPARCQFEGWVLSFLYFLTVHCFGGVVPRSRGCGIEFHAEYYADRGGLPPSPHGHLDFF